MKFDTEVLKRAMVGAVVLAMVWSVIGSAAPEERRFDVIVFGVGISGLAAAWESVSVAVIEMSAHPGGTAMKSAGYICIIGTPEQREAGIPDSPQISLEDFMEFCKDEGGPGPNAEWVAITLQNPAAQFTIGSQGSASASRKTFC